MKKQIMVVTDCFPCTFLLWLTT